MTQENKWPQRLWNKDTPRVDVRQTVLYSSVDANGAPNFISAGTGLSVDIAATSVPVVVTAAGGADAIGPVDRVGVISADTVIGSLQPNNTNYLYADINEIGLVTLGFTVNQPQYTQGGAAAGLDFFTFRRPLMTGYVGDGSNPVPTFRVFMGEAVTDLTNVTSVVNYALQGKYTSPDTALLAGGSQLYQIDHNIGVKQVNIKIYLRILIAGVGYVIGDVVEPASFAVGPSYPGPILTRLSTPNVAHFPTGPGGSTGFMVPALTGVPGIFQDISAAGANYFVIAERGW